MALTEPDHGEASFRSESPPARITDQDHDLGMIVPGHVTKPPVSAGGYEFHGQGSVRQVTPPYRISDDTDTGA